jgi:Rrf2 family protein
MLLSQTAEYALRAVVCMAHRGSRPFTTQQLADSTLVPASYLPKVMQPLTRAGIVTAHRGSNGGYMLAADPALISVQEIVDCVDAAPRGDVLADLKPADSACLASLQRLLRDTVDVTRTRWSTTSLADLVSQSRCELCAGPHTKQEDLLG